MVSCIELPRLPVIDLSLFDVGYPWRDQVAAQIDAARGEFGFFFLVGQGIGMPPPQELKAYLRLTSAPRSSRRIRCAMCIEEKYFSYFRCSVLRFHSAPRRPHAEALTPSLAPDSRRRGCPIWYRRALKSTRCSPVRSLLTGAPDDP